MLVLTPASRASDPATSHMAEQHINSTGARAFNQHLAHAAVKAHPGHTSLELSQLARCCRFGLAKRLPECETAGLVRKGATKQCDVSGRRAVTWWPIEPGDQFELPVAA